ncbi:mechanosensitive ion channel [Leptolyngbya sp. FACHB-671]|uniref:mechanosensitive ion channel family protein n=1 Tax=Leptolyngbya sp. FACHB-671 TaxID=2692812 RepID=UPI001684860F|nr:mechanosensitive ion channel domain-containing protein [Leptolyngbya sp. FACHB-671]MBD2067253.1 mechanosensitive ion channel [Leptolyngbya sp. FACHB-671]
MAPHRLLSAISQILQTVGIALILTLILLIAPAIAQKEIPASVVLDGREIFQISPSGEYTATERAELVNSLLQEAVQEDQPVQIEIEQRNGLPTIRLNDRHLMTVTDRDAPLGRTPEEQARELTRRLRDAVQQAQQQRTAEFLRWAGTIAVGVVAIATLLHWGLGEFWQRSLRPSLAAILPQPNADEDETIEHPQALNLLVNLLLAIARTGVWLGATLYITNLFPLTRQWGYRIFNSLIASFTSPIITLGQSSYSVTDLLVLAFMLLGLIVFTKMATDLLKSRILQMTGVNRGAQEAVAVIIRYAMLFIGSLVVLQIWGLDISSLAILVSALGVGIGFGLQDIAKNFGSGLVLVFERPIQVGDFIEVGEFQGNVERIGARSTLIRTLDQISIIVPNSRFLEQEVINWSHDNPVSRIHLPVGVAYGSDIEAVRSALLESARNHPKILSTPQPQVFFKEFGDSSLNFELLVWTAEPSKQVVIKSDLYFRMEALLRQNQVDIPFPQRDLHLQVDHLPLKLSPKMEQMVQQWLERSQL